MIGGLRTAALVSKYGSIDWLCLPHFDSPSMFARLLDQSGGSFSVDTTGYHTTSQYVDETAIVEMLLNDESTELSLRDFMVPHDIYNVDANQYLVRAVSCRRGHASLTFRFDPAPDYARGAIDWQQHNKQLVAACGQDWLVLHLPPGATLQHAKAGYEIQLELAAGTTEQLVLEYQPTRQMNTKLPEALEKITLDFWHDWVAKGHFVDFCRDGQVRSAITLKLMQFAPTGAIVAAPTTALPESLGGVRNWDYRYTWVRDATFTLYAFHVLGYMEEAEHFFDFILGILDECSHRQFDISLMYTIFGAPVPDEVSLDNLSGYKDSRPVRIGNGAAQQFQLDVYGSLIDAIYFATQRGISEERKDRTRKLVMNLVRKIEQDWKEPDAGIWEVRSGKQQFVYSRVMCWVGADRAKRLQAILNFSDKDAQVCHNLSREIKDWLWHNGYLSDAKNFSQYPGTSAVDATNLLFVLLQFLDKHDPQTKEITDNTCRKLSYKEAFIYRYLGEDGLPGKEGAFILCSFWLVSALAILEDTDAALRLFKKIENVLAPSGLIAEEIDPATGQYLGNYPQAFSHIGYIMSAYYLDKYTKHNMEER